MTPTGIIIVLVAAPALALTVLRVNAVLVFLSLCLGQVLVQFAGPEAIKTVGILAGGTGWTSPSIVSLALLFLPAIFTTIIMVGTVKGHAKLMFNILPAVSVGILSLLLAVPLLSTSMRLSIEMAPVWGLVQGLQPLAIGLSAIISILFLWLQRPKSAPKEDKHHKGH